MSGRNLAQIFEAAMGYSTDVVEEKSGLSITFPSNFAQFANLLVVQGVQTLNPKEIKPLGQIELTGAVSFDELDKNFENKKQIISLNKPEAAVSVYSLTVATNLFS